MESTLSLINGISPLLWTCIALSISALLFLSRRASRVQGAGGSKTSSAAKTMSAPVVKEPPPPGCISVSRILIHPIKSCRATSVQFASYTPEGLENDRKWTIIDANKLQILTAREVPKMVLIEPQVIKDESLPYGGTLRVTFPESSGCESFDVPLDPNEEHLKNWTILPKITLWPTHDPVDGYICESASASGPSPSVVLSRYFEKPVHLVYKGPQPRAIDPTTAFPELDATAVYQDMYPLLVLSEESTAVVDERLREYVGTQGIEEKWKTEKVMIERFRPNIVLKGGGPFAEDDWEEIMIGSEGAPSIALVSKCTRCLLPNVSPETGERDKAVPYKVLMKFRTGIDEKEKLKPCVGCNGVPKASGVVRVGDGVTVKKMIGA